MKKHKKIILVNLIIVFVMLTIAFLFGIWIKNADNTYNWNLVSLIVNNVVVIDIFITTFTLIDNRNIRKETNKEKIATEMLSLTYKECQKYMDILTDTIVRSHIIPKCDFNKTVNEKDNVIFTNLKNAPFTFENQILDFSKEGIVNSENFSNYINLKQLYKGYIEMRLTFFDAPEVYEPLKKELKDYIDKHSKNIKLS